MRWSVGAVVLPLRSANDAHSLIVILIAGCCAKAQASAFVLRAIRCDVTESPASASGMAGLVVGLSHQ